MRKPALRIRYKGAVYKVLRFEQTGDWSLVVIWDRKRREEQAMHTFSSAAPEPIETPVPEDPMRATYHTTGQVNYHGWVSAKPSYFERLHELSSPNMFIAVSIPAIDRLDLAGDQNALAVDIADDLGSDRITLGVFVAPLGTETPPNALVRLDYDLFCAVVVTLPSPEIPNGLEQHFLHMAPAGLKDRRDSSPNEAMLAYHQRRVDGGALGVYPPNGEGVYTLFTSVMMAKVPQLKITFSDPKLRIEVDTERAKPMMVPFSIYSGTNRVTKGDLRHLISSIELCARL